MIDALDAQTLIAGGEVERGLMTYRDSLRANPNRTALIYGYADALITANKAADAVQFLSGRLDGRTGDPQLYEYQARAYTVMGKRLLQHRALAEVYALRGNVPAAIEQLQIAQKAEHFGRLFALGRFDRMEALGAQGRFVAQIAPDQKLFVRCSRQSAALGTAERKE